MASIDSALITRLKNFAGLSALVGARVFAHPLPTKSTAYDPYPCVEIAQTHGRRDYVMGGQSGLVRAHFDIWAWDDSPAKVRAIAEQVRRALSGYSGTSDTVTIDHIELMDEDRVDNASDAVGDDTAIVQDYLVWYRETIPT